jgi:hypothetical protein
MNAIITFGSVALAALAFSAVPSKADTPDTFTRHGLPLPEAYFKNKESQQPATVAVSMPGKVVGEQKQKMSKAGKKRTKRVRQFCRDKVKEARKEYVRLLMPARNRIVQRKSAESRHLPFGFWMPGKLTCFIIRCV